MSWIRCSKANNYTEDGGIDTTGVDYICQGCDTEREAKASMRRFRALGYELYDEKTSTEYAGDLKTAYRALNRFAVRNNFTDVAGYRLSFRRERDKYRNIKGMIEYEQKLSRASEAEVADFGSMWKVLGLTFAAFVVVFIVALIVYTGFDVASGGAFSLTIDIFFWISVAGMGTILVIGVVYGIASNCGFAWHYGLSKLRKLVKQDRKEFENQSEAGEGIEDGREDIAMSDSLGVVDVLDFAGLAPKDDADKENENKGRDDG